MAALTITQRFGAVVDAFLGVVRMQPGLLAEADEVAGEPQLLAVG